MENKKQSLTDEKLSSQNLSNLIDENVNRGIDSDSTNETGTNREEGEDVVKVIPRAFSSSALRINAKEKFSFWERMHSGYDTDIAGSTNSPVRYE